jgi:lycopene cyclase domain-containing protein
VNALYLAGLLVALAGLTVLDWRLRLFLFDAPVRAAALLAIGVAGYLAWDLGGIGLGIFFEGDRRLLVGIDVAPQVPLEELFFLLVLCLTTMEAFTAALRLLSPAGTTEDARTARLGKRIGGVFPPNLRRSGRGPQ